MRYMLLSQRYFHTVDEEKSILYLSGALIPYHSFALQVFRNTFLSTRNKLFVLIINTEGTFCAVASIVS